MRAKAERKPMERLPFLWIYQLDSGDMEPMICEIEARRMAVCGETTQRSEVVPRQPHKLENTGSSPVAAITPAYGDGCGCGETPRNAVSANLVPARDPCGRDGSQVSGNLATIKQE